MLLAMCIIAAWSILFWAICIKSLWRKLLIIGKDFYLIKNEISKEFIFSEDYINNYNCNDLLKFSKWLIQSSDCLSEPKPIYLRKSEAELSLLKNK